MKKINKELKYGKELRTQCKNIKFKNVFFNFGWVVIIGWFSVILFLVDFADRTGEWQFHFIALFFAITSFGALVIEFLDDKNKYKQKNEQ